MHFQIINFWPRFCFLAICITFFSFANSANSQDCESNKNFAQNFYQNYQQHLATEISAPVPSFSIGAAPQFEASEEKILPLMQTIYCTKNGKKIKESRIKLYGWFDVGANISSANTQRNIATGEGGNSPIGYYNYANQITLNQAVVNLERLPDTINSKKIDYGFRFTGLYGTDYQYTFATHLLSNQYIKDHKKYGFDPMLAYFDIYIPYVAQGLNIRVGRYFALQDVESVLAPNNFTYGHSLLNTFDTYTHQGANATLKLNKNWKTQFEIFNGSDVAINDSKNSRLSFGTCLNYTTNSANDSFYGCLSGLNNGQYAYDNLQVYSLVWAHKFNEKWQMNAQTYYMWQKNVPNLNNPGADAPISGTRSAQCQANKLECKSNVIAAAHYLTYQFSQKDFLTLRNDFFKDNHGQRTGYNTLYSSHTIGWTHWIGDVITIRPELRFDRSYSAKVFDNGNKSTQYIAAADMIIHF